MVTNVNPVTGVRYGIISANSLDFDLVCDLQSAGNDLHWEARLAEIRLEVDEAVERGEVSEEDADETYDLRVEKEGDAWTDEEPEHEFYVEGVRGQTVWLGGGLLIWIFASPWKTKANLCGPCVPGCGDLDSLNPDGYECYDVPPTWRYAP